VLFSDSNPNAMEKSDITGFNMAWWSRDLFFTTQ